MRAMRLALKVSRFAPNDARVPARSRTESCRTPGSAAGGPSRAAGKNVDDRRQEGREVGRRARLAAPERHSATIPASSTDEDLIEREKPKISPHGHSAPGIWRSRCPRWRRTPGEEDAPHDPHAGVQGAQAERAAGEHAQAHHADLHAVQIQHVPEDRGWPRRSSRTGTGSEMRTLPREKTITSRSRRRSRAGGVSPRASG